MPATYPDLTLNQAAEADAARYAYASIHGGDPGVTGAYEASGGSPAYARKLVTWRAGGAQGPLGPTLTPATPGICWSEMTTFDLLGGSWSHSGFWDQPTSGAFLGGKPLGATFTPTVQDTLEICFGVGPAAAA